MKIYDRYGGSPAHARRQQHWFFAKTLLKPLKYAIIWLLILGIPWGFARQEVLRYVGVFGALIVALAFFFETVVPLRLNDLYTFGYDGKDFALLGIHGGVRSRLAPEEILEIDISPARWPWHRTRADMFRWRFSGGINFQSVKKSRVAEPMALLVTKKDMRRGLERKRTSCASKDSFFYWNIAFIPRGDNCSILIHLLRETSCPIAVKAGFYMQHKDFLDKVFARSGMDLSRLQFMQEESRRAQITRII